MKNQGIISKYSGLFAVLLVATTGMTGCSSDSDSSGGNSSSASGGSGSGGSICDVSDTSFTGLDSVTSVAGTTARLNWTDVADAEVYFIYDVTSGTPSLVGHVDAPATQFNLTGLTQSTSYTYRVRVVDDESLFDSNTNDVSFTTTAQNTYLLDSVSGAVSAFSTRQLTNTYSGAALRVRRDSDDLEQDIGFDSNGDLDVADLTSFLGGANGFVSIWYDQVGGHDVSQSTNGYQPSIVVSGTTGGKPSINFDGVDDHLYDSSAGYTARTAFTYWRAETGKMLGSDLGQVWGHYGGGTHVAPDGRSVGSVSLDGSGGAGGFWAIDGGALSGSSTTSASSGWSLDTWHQYVVEFTVDKTMNEHTIGSLYPDFAVGAHQFGGDIPEVIIFGGQVSGGEKGTIEADQASHF